MLRAPPKTLIVSMSALSQLQSSLPNATRILIKLHLILRRGRGVDRDANLLIKRILELWHRVRPRCDDRHQPSDTIHHSHDQNFGWMRGRRESWKMSKLRVEEGKHSELCHRHESATLERMAQLRPIGSVLGLHFHPFFS